MISQTDFGPCADRDQEAARVLVHFSQVTTNNRLNNSAWGHFLFLLHCAMDFRLAVANIVDPFKCPNPPYREWLGGLGGVV